MGLTGRSSWVLALVVGAVLFSNPGAPLDDPRQIVLYGACGAWIVLHVVAYVVGIRWPDQFHYGAEQRLEVRRMEQLGDSLLGTRRDAEEPQEKP